MMPLALLLSVLVGVALGLLGGGGSILTTPILLYVVKLPEQEAITTSLVVVGVTSLFGAAQHARAGNVDLRAGAAFGAAGIAGALGGGYLSGLLPPGLPTILFALMMLITAGAMFRGRKEPSAPPPPSPWWRALVLGAAVGAITGLVGAGGGFMVVPALALIGGLPMKRAVGTSLLVIAMNSFAGVLGHIAHVQVEPRLTALMCAAAVLGSVAGRRASAQVPADTLRRGFAVFVFLMGLFVLFQSR